MIGSLSHQHMHQNHENVAYLSMDRYYLAEFFEISSLTIDIENVSDLFGQWNGIDG